MLYRFKDLVRDNGFVPRGVLHVGAHMAEEADDYRESGVRQVLWLEANPALIEPLRSKVSRHPNSQVLQALVSDIDGDTRDFFITNNGQSSSILPLGIHKQYYPDIVVTDTIKLTTTTIKSLLAKNKIAIEDYNFLNIDIQGAELLALRGLGDLIRSFDAIYLEVNFNSLYQGCPMIEEIDQHLNQYGFRRKTTIRNDAEWGDALYMRSGWSSFVTAASLAAPPLRERNARTKSRGVIQMSRFGTMGRFGNQVIQYAFMKSYGRMHDLEVQLPPWVGNTLFGCKDAPIDRPLPMFTEPTFHEQDPRLMIIPRLVEPLCNVDIASNFQYPSRWYAPNKKYIRSLFHPVPGIAQPLQAAEAKLRANAKTVVAMHIRRGDYGYGLFYLTPVEWYREWLEIVWPTLDRPALYIASDDPETIRFFEDFRPSTAESLGLSVPEAPYYPDFYMLSRADVLAIPNSTFSFAASMLNENLKLSVRSHVTRPLARPPFKAYDPWNSSILDTTVDVSQFPELASAVQPPHLVPTTLTARLRRRAVRLADAVGMKEVLRSMLRRTGML